MNKIALHFEKCIFFVTMPKYDFAILVCSKSSKPQSHTFMCGFEQEVTPVSCFFTTERNKT